MYQIPQIHQPCVYLHLLKVEFVAKQYNVGGRVLCATTLPVNRTKSFKINTDI